MRYSYYVAEDKVKFFNLLLLLFSPPSGTAHRRQLVLRFRFRFFKKSYFNTDNTNHLVLPAVVCTDTQSYK